MIRKKKYKNILVNRIAIILPAIAVQGFWMYLLLTMLSPYSALLDHIFTGLAVLFVLYLISKRDEPSYKILWLLVILVFPVLGAALYLSFGNKSSGRVLKRQLEKAREELGPPSPQDDGVLAEMKENNLRIYQIFHMMTRLTGFPAVYGENCVYYPCGEKLYEDYLYELKKAERFIFIEYFIIEDGVMWDSILDILSEKAENDVDVRVIYDDLGCIGTLPSKYYKVLNSNKIKCVKFNPFIFSLSGRLNNRDHRKITVIDGNVAFSGGINLADEYINEKEKFGYWKDVGYKLTGQAAESFGYMFAEFWNAFSMNNDFPIHRKLIGESILPAKVPEGIVLSYYDSPVGKHNASVSLISEMLSRCEKYAWFYTPYLMLGDDLMNAFEHAAERGTDIRIIMPGIPDKKMIFRISRSYYRPLLEAGVRIFEYEPGFVHAKGCVSDDILCTVGSVNLDYRSLFLHFECNTLFYGSPVIQSLKDDFENTLKECREVTLSDTEILGGNVFHRIVNGVLRLFAPLC